MNGYLIDTNVLSEARKAKPDSGVTAFLESERSDRFFVSTVSFAEIRRGIELLVEPHKRSVISSWLSQSLRPYFGERVLHLTEDVILESLRIVSLGKLARLTFSQEDVWLAATARCNGLSLATRNYKDFLRFGVPLLNPWTGEQFSGS